MWNSRRPTSPCQSVVSDALIYYTYNSNQTKNFINVSEIFSLQAANWISNWRDSQLIEYALATVIGNARLYTKKIFNLEYLILVFVNILHDTEIIDVILRKIRSIRNIAV